MKRKLTLLASVFFALGLAVPVFAANDDLYASYSSMRSGLFILIAVTAISIILSVYLTVTLMKAGRKKAHHGRVKKSFYCLMMCAYVVSMISLIFTVFCGSKYQKMGALLQGGTLPSGSENSTISSSEQTNQTDSSSQPETKPSETTVPTQPDPTLNVTMTDKSNPSNWAVKWDIIVNEAVTGSYNRKDPITFGNPNKESFSALNGVTTFRGDNYRTGATYGLSNIVNHELTTVWQREISAISKPGSGYWTGAGWTGQPLIVEWDYRTKQLMNLYPEKKEKDNLVEVIYATLDGHIYFYDLEDGTYTRDPMNIGMAFKGSGSLDPRGYPILYVGSGDKTKDGTVPRMYIINLLDCSIMYQRGNQEPLKHRNWIAFDSAPLVDPETDTLIWPGESGMIYTIKLNSKYDMVAGTLSINPETPVMTRYTTSTGNTVGFESSGIIVENYLYIADNGGMMFCIDLNTMKPAWAQFVHDDTNATPCFEWGEDGKGYLYTGSSMEFNDGKVVIAKLDASTGEFVWQKEFTNVYYDSSVSGGILSSPVLGKPGTELEDVVIYTIARTPGYYNGVMIALNKDTGEIVWEKSLKHYTWSSPVALYNEDGSAHIVYCDFGGYVHMLDGKTGETLKSLSVGANVEASPAVYNDILVVGTRGQQVYGIKLS